MGNVVKRPGEDGSAPIESRRSTVPEADAEQPDPGAAGAETAIDLPDMGELSPESARPSPLDEIVDAERENAPRD